MILALILAACKGPNVKLFKTTTGAQWRADFTAVTAADTLFAAAYGLLGGALLLVTRRWKRLHAWLFRVWVAMGMLFVVFALVSVQVFGFLRTPLTYPLLYIAGDFSNMRSSLGAFLTPQMIGWLIAAPLGFVLLSWLATRYLRPRPNALGRILIAVPLLFVAWHAWYALRVREDWRWRNDRRLIESPHYVFLRSCVDQITGQSTVRLSGKFPESYREDFTTVSERAPALSRKQRLAATRTTSDASAQAFPALAPPRNVILVVLESVGTQHLSLYGSKYPTTPRLLAERASSLVYTAHYAHQGMSANSLFNLLTSAYTPISWKHVTLESRRSRATTLGHVLKARGYQTAYMTSTDTRWAAFREFLENRGYDSIEDFRDLSAGESVSSWTVEDRFLIDHANAWIDRVPDKQPFFLTLWTGQAHHPYALKVTAEHPEINYVGQDPNPSAPTLNRYLNVLAETDRQIGRLLDHLRERKLADDTLVIIVGDHGEAFNDPHEVSGHGLALYDEVIKVPFILWNPRLFKSGDTASIDPSIVTGHVDMAPTVTHLLGLPPAPGWQGRSLFADSRTSDGRTGEGRTGNGRTGRAYFFSAGYDYILGVREGPLKYTFNANTGQEELYNLTADPREQTNIAAGNRPACEQFRQRLAAWCADHEHREALNTQQRSK